MGNTVTIDVIAEVQKAVAGLDTVNDSLGRVEAKAGSGLPALKGMLAADAISGGIDMLRESVTAAYSAVQQQSQLGAQTSAVLASTGAAAGLTADGVTSLADAIEAKTMIDAEQVQSGENMLLTFTNIKDAAGAGNDVFTQTTAIVADMSTALGTDMATQAVQVGKALNDPIAGVSALSRVGVTFTDQQKAQIKAMSDAGDTMGAQKLVLAELNKEFGGSAEAAGKTFPGAMKHVKDVLDGVVEGSLKKFIPLLQDGATWLGQNLPPAIETGSAAFDKLAAALKPAADAAGALIGWMKDNPETVKAFALTLGILGGAVAVVTAAQWAWNLAMTANPIGLIIVGIAALVAAIVWVVTNWNSLSAAVSKVVGDMGAAISGFAAAIGKWFSDGVAAAGAAINSIPGQAANALAGLAQIGANAGRSLMDGLARGITDAASGVYNSAQAALTSVGNLFPHSPAHEGPFSGAGYTDQSGAALFRDFGRGMLAGGAGAVDDARTVMSAVRGATQSTATPALWTSDAVAASPSPLGAAGIRQPAPEVTINVNVPPTADKAAIGREIARALDDYYAATGRRP